MSSIASTDHDVIVASQDSIRLLHEAKMAANKLANEGHSLRVTYKVRTDFEPIYERAIALYVVIRVKI